ncbi:MAG: 6-phosphofructokinase [Chloroflexi bacterium]|jgi:6-phosphofructokinase 1|nr:MAG: 6-phosphofructokinase [Chloroflexi bacterium OLB13]MBC6956964.1 6-phosphofructokinase [Chloroflexota bacterium]MBV6436257.1 ATP-dependent 6-phosphofructokinase [Anaerolineae bacterium]MDL1915084.1 6-phosphofructokinase [Anaerolineae bacterium CFX4]MBW7878441.1 6-phosphofructokinase [Anaerolineae bacterium]
MKRIAVMTSGGDAPGMNAAVRAVVRTAMEHDVETYGIRQAFAGLLNGEMTLLSSREVSGILQRGGTILQTARNEEFKTPQGQRKAQRILQEHGIEGVIVIGGDGSLRGAMALDRQGIKVVGVPASIDNDIWGTNMCIGVDTSLNTILDALDRLRDTANSHNRGFVIEVMGRNCGYLALMGGILGGAEIIVTPEDPPTMEDVALALEDAYKRGKSHAIAVISEGAPYRTTDLADYLNSRHTGFEIRITILGHTQRGGSPTAFDRLLASRMGVAAVEYLLAGQTSIMVGLDGREISTVSLADATTKPRLISPQYFKMAHTLSR